MALENTEALLVTDIKYLGVQLDRSLSFGKHVRNATNKAILSRKDCSRHRKVQLWEFSEQERPFHFAMSSGSFRPFFDQRMIQIDNFVVGSDPCSPSHQVLITRSASHHAGLTKHRALSYGQSDLALESMGRPYQVKAMIFSPSGSRNKSIFRPLWQFDAEKISFRTVEAAFHKWFFDFPFVYRSVTVVPIFHTFGFFPWLLNVGKLLLGSHLVFVQIVVAIGLGLHPIMPAIPRLRTFSLHQDVHCLLNRNLHS